MRDIRGGRSGRVRMCIDCEPMTNQSVHIREFILAEIRRIAGTRNGVPPGIILFKRETGISQSAWLGKLWLNWSEAVEEAGLSPNSMNSPIDSDDILVSLCRLILALQKWPTKAELINARQANIVFPSHNVFTSKFGTKATQILAVKRFCEENPEFVGVIPFLPRYNQVISYSNQIPEIQLECCGFVYLMKAGSRTRYKVGCSSDPDQRLVDIGRAVPDKLKLVHKIKTDDPSGIEAYWHRRFRSYRVKNTQEWFSLPAVEIAAFRSRSFM